MKLNSMKSVLTHSWYKKLFGEGDATFTLAALMLFVVFVFGVFAFLSQLVSPLSAHAANPNWDVTGAYVVTFDGYQHDMSLTQDNSGNVTGNGGYPAGGPFTYAWAITSGTVVGNAMNLTADYTLGATGTTMHMTGTIAPSGSMSGAWDDNYGGSRVGTWSTVSGNAAVLPGSLAAEDFGVVNYDAGGGLGILKGYTAGFGLTDATFTGAQSVVVQLFSGATLLQTNTAILPKFHADITGVQFSSPFDVSGTFNYVSDGYWVNHRESQYGQSVPATRVVATVTLASGKVVTAENTSLTGDATTIYPNIPPAPEMVKVTIDKFVQKTMATESSAHGAAFPMSSEWAATNTGAGTGEYTLSDTNEVPYQAVTSEMTVGADYSTHELVNGDVVGAQCATGKPFALEGYTTGNTYAEAAAGTPTMPAPTFTNLQNDKFVIVWNRDCSLPEGQIGGDVVEGDGILEVTSIDSIDTTATANGTFTSGWKYVFHITAPTSEQNLAMKFSNWLRTGGSGTIPAANNMRISSLQADNGGATILITAQNTYSTPALHMTGDLNSGMDGRQVEVTVEVAVPAGTPNGSYTTNYGVQSTL